MKLHELRAPEGATKKPKRKGRGTATGQGKTAGRGMNGQNSRSGGGVRPGFEGGQIPLFRRLPKRGFTNSLFKKEYAIINLETLDKLFNDGDAVSMETLLEKGVIRKELNGLKVLGRGEITKKLTVKAAIFSASAKEKIEAAGGKAEVI